MLSGKLPKKALSAKDNKNILVTGCSSGIGKCTARILMDKGYRVFATARYQDDVNALQVEGFESLQLDLNNSESIIAAVKEILNRTDGHIYALFNNGAYGQPGAVEDLTREVLRKQFETNVLGTQELTNLIIPVMRRQGYGRIIQNSSVLGLVCLSYRGAYNASKYALEALSDTMRLELRDTGIFISLIEPGPIESRFRKNAFKAYQDNINKEHSSHLETYDAMESRLNKVGRAVPFTLPADAVANKVIHALESRRPKIRYYVTFPTYLFTTLKHLLSFKTMDRLMFSVGDGMNKQKHKN